MFRYRLQTMLRLQIAERDRRRSELAKALRAEAVLQDQQALLVAEQGELAERSRTLKLPGAANVDALLQTHRYEIVLAARLRQLRAQMAEVAAETERRRQAVVEADRQVRVLEKLRDRQAAAHQRQLARAEVKQFDELGGQGYVRRREAQT